MFKGRRRNLQWGGLKMAELELDTLILHFEQSNKAEGKSPKTVSRYSEMLNDFAKFPQVRGINTILAEFDVNNVREFIAHTQCKSL